MKIAKMITLFCAVLFTASVTASMTIKTIKLPNSKMVIKLEEQDKEYIPLALNLYSNNTSKKIDEYSHEGGPPIFKDHKFITINGKKHLLILIMWDISHYDVSGQLYQTYVYDLTKKGLVKNKIMSNDGLLQGSTLWYRDEGNSRAFNDKLYLVKNYLKAKYGKQQLAENLCGSDDKIIFSCRLNNNKTVSICDNKTDTYKYGKKNKVELSQELVGNSKLNFTNDAHNTTVSFKRGDVTYTIKEHGKQKSYTTLLAEKESEVIFTKLCVNTSNSLPAEAFFN